jgi:DNA-binding MarR family transcriptional regulator
MIGETRARETTTVGALADDLERIAVGTVGLTTRGLAHAETGLELTFPQWRAMLVVGDAADGARVGEVAARVGVTVPATSRLLRRLERRGLTTLGTDDADHRATRVRLTERGQSIRAAIIAHRRDALEAVAANLPDPAHLDLATGLGLIGRDLERFA